VFVVASEKDEIEREYSLLIWVAALLGRALQKVVSKKNSRIRKSPGGEIYLGIEKLGCKRKDAKTFWPFRPKKVDLW